MICSVKKMGPNRCKGLLHPCMLVDLSTSHRDIRKAILILDSGASVSVVHETLLDGVKKSMRRIVGRRFVTANGKSIGNGLLATFECVVDGTKKKIKVVDALITNTKESGTQQILLGSQDLRKAGIVIDLYRGLIGFEAGVRKVIPMKERPVKEGMRVIEDTSKLKDRRSTDFGTKLLDYQKSDGNRKNNVVVTGNSVRQRRGDNKNAKAEDAKFAHEKNNRLVEIQEKHRYKVKKAVKGVRRIRGIAKKAVENRNNVNLTQKGQRVGDEEAVKLSRYNCSEVNKDNTTSSEMSICYERVVDKNTVRNRYNVDFTQDVGSVMIDIDADTDRKHRG
jgi:hypothetical protein